MLLARADCQCQITEVAAGAACFHKRQQNDIKPLGEDLGCQRSVCWVNLIVITVKYAPNTPIKLKRRCFIQLRRCLWQCPWCPALCGRRGLLSLANELSILMSVHLYIAKLVGWLTEWCHPYFLFESLVGAIVPWNHALIASLHYGQYHLSAYMYISVLTADNTSILAFPRGIWSSSF